MLGAGCAGGWLCSGSKGENSLAELSKSTIRPGLQIPLLRGLRWQLAPPEPGSAALCVGCSVQAGTAPAAVLVPEGRLGQGQQEAWGAHLLLRHLSNPQGQLQAHLGLVSAGRNLKAETQPGQGAPGLL